VIDRTGSVAWIGHPMELKETVLDEVLAGTYDTKKAAAEAAEMGKNQAKLMELSQKLGSAMQGKKFDEAESALNEIEKLLPEAQREGLAFARFGIVVAKGDAKGASEAATKLLAKNGDNAMMLNQLAWTMLTSKDLKDPDTGVIEKIAVQASKAAQDKDASILDTLARAYWVNGKKDKAVETQAAAVKLAPEEQRDQLKKSLESYKEGKLPSVDE
jgi:predicted Zn-dependent protease